MTMTCDDFDRQVAHSRRLLAQGPVDPHALERRARAVLRARMQRDAVREASYARPGRDAGAWLFASAVALASVLASVARGWTW